MHKKRISNSNKGLNLLAFKWLPQPSNHLISACAFHCSQFIVYSVIVLPFSISLSMLRSDVWEHWKIQRFVCTGIIVHPSKYFPAKDKETVKSQKTKIDSFITKTVCYKGHMKKITNLIIEVLNLRPAAMVGLNTS